MRMTLILKCGHIRLPEWRSVNPTLETNTLETAERRSIALLSTTCCMALGSVEAGNNWSLFIDVHINE